MPVTVTTEFVQGKTWRWGVAWSFDDTLKEKVRVENNSEDDDHYIAGCDHAWMCAIFFFFFFLTIVSVYQ